MRRSTLIRSLCLVFTLTLLAGCGAGANPQTSAAPTANTVPSATNASSPTNAPSITNSPSAAKALSAANLNLIFVVSPDLTYQAAGDVNPDTANLSNQGLQRSLLMATYLKKQVLGGQNVNRIYALEPMSHLQTANKYPDMAAIGYIQQFAQLNQISLTGTGGYGSPPITSYSYPISASYSSGPIPSGAAAPLPSAPCPGCQGLDFNDTAGSNEALVANLLAINYPGFYVFSAPWETVSSLMANIDKQQSSKLNLPTAYTGPNDLFAISITPSGSPSLVTYHSNLNPASTYPALPSPVGGAACTAQKPFNLSVADGVNGAKTPVGINTNETVYFVRHAEAHPSSWGWDDGNVVAAGQWRALALPDALRGKISPSAVYAIDPAQVIPNDFVIAGSTDFSYVRPALTAEPYAIANNLPYYLVSEFELFDPSSSKLTSDKFFSGGTFSNKTILLAWEHDHFPPIVNALLASYFPAGKALTAPAWPDDDYDSIWSVTLDARGNLTVGNAICEGIDSAKLPATPPQY